MFHLKLYRRGSTWAGCRVKAPLDLRTASHLKRWLEEKRLFFPPPDLTKQTRLNFGAEPPPDWLNAASVWCVQQFSTWMLMMMKLARTAFNSVRGIGIESPLFDLWTNRTSGEKRKVMSTPHWTAAAPAAPLRRLTHVYILKRKNFRIVFSVSNPFLTLASKKTFGYLKRLNPYPPSCLFNLFSCFLTSVFCFPPLSVAHVCILSWYNLFCCMKY